MTDTTNATPAAAGLLSGISAISKWTQVAALAVVCLFSLWYFDKLPAWPATQTDPIVSTKVDGLGVSITAIEDRVGTIELTAAAKADVAEIAARLAVVEAKVKEPAKSAPLTTGSISKKR